MAKKVHGSRLRFKNVKVAAQRSRRKQLAKKKTPDNVSSQIFWPDHLDHVKSIALRGLTDDEMAIMMNISSDLLESWKIYYPTFAKAIEDGRTRADVEVVQALHKNAVGHTYETDEVVKTRTGGMVVTVSKHVPGETAAQKFWLQNRQPAHWNIPQQVSVGGRGKGDPIHVVAEHKNEVINSILNLITPKPDAA